MSGIHFQTAHSWSAARLMLSFDPLKPEYTAGLRLQSLRVHICDHKLRELPIGDRTLEAHYGHFVFTQAKKGAAEARRLALEVRYGSECTEAWLGARAARVYELGPEPESDDIDRRSPSVVTWHDAEMFYLIASDEMPADELVRIADSLYASGRRRSRSARSHR